MTGVQLDDTTAAAAFARAADTAISMPTLAGRGVVMAAGGDYLPSAYVTIRLLRHFGCSMPIEVWHAGDDEKPSWTDEAFQPWGVIFKNVLEFEPTRPASQLQGWPLKAAALRYSSLRKVLFLDADCFPVRDLTFLLNTAEFRERGALFWPDHKRHKLVDRAPIWSLTGVDYRGDTEFETGIMALDRESRWRELCLTNWMNEQSEFWYQHTLGDKDTFYLAWRKLGTPYFLAPPSRRIRMIGTRQFWTDGKPVAFHRTGSSKYDIPHGGGLFVRHLRPYKWRSKARNVADELLQRFVVENFRLHVGWLRELRRISDRPGPVAANSYPRPVRT